METAFVVRPGERAEFDLGMFAAVPLADTEQTGGAFSLLRTEREPPGFGPPLHRHQDAAEAFFVLQGRYLLYVDDRQEDCPAGTFAYVPQGVPHTFRVVSQTPGTKLNLFTPAAMTGFFADLAAAEAAGDASPETVDTIAARHAMDVLGPVPDTYLRLPDH
jgi:mannose-6-phosphate isomerase-like protein (cupin superfamily)